MRSLDFNSWQKIGGIKMSIFKDTTVVEALFEELWTKMINETEFGLKLKENELSIFFMTEDPEVVMYVDADGPLFGEEAKLRNPVVTMKMSGDTVHKFWLKQVNVPKALALRQIRAKGPVAKILQILPLLKPGFAIYPEYCKKYNLPMD
jgi:putative sterol carrier protein